MQMNIYSLAKQTQSVITKGQWGNSKNNNNNNNMENKQNLNEKNTNHRTKSLFWKYHLRSWKVTNAIWHISIYIMMVPISVCEEY